MMIKKLGKIKTQVPTGDSVGLSVGDAVGLAVGEAIGYR